jgi:hypothetical protein
MGYLKRRSLQAAETVGKCSSIRGARASPTALHYDGIHPGTTMIVHSSRNSACWQARVHTMHATLFRKARVGPRVIRDSFGL